MKSSLGLRDHITHLNQHRVRLLSPPPKLTVSEWADRYRMVPSYSAESGRWVTDRTPYLREIMDSFSEVGVNKVVFKKCARIGATEAGLNIVGYFIHQDPSAIMIVQPTVDDAKDFSKEQLAPTIEDTPELRERVSDEVKNSKNTITAKVFPGGSVVLGGANSPRFFRRRTIRVLILEEINGFGGSLAAKREGSQIKLAEKRTETMGYRRKIYANSTPTTVGECAITAEFEKSDQRFFHVPCPHCHHAQPLEWARLIYKDLDEPKYQCAQCETLIDEADKDAMVAAGQWAVTKPFALTRGYHINALYSPFVRWAKLVEEWQDAHNDPEALRVFINTALGQAWEDRETANLASSVKDRAKPYGPPDAKWRVPRGACILTCGVDKQPGELHAVVRAYGPREQSWLIDRVLFRGDTSQPQVWSELDQWRLSRTYTHEAGAPMKIRAMCVDSGDDPQPVYLWTRPRLSEFVFAIKGASDPTADILPRKFTRTSVKSRLYIIGTQAVKKRLLARAAMKVPEPYTLDAGAGFFHVNERADDAYIAEFFSNKLVRHMYRGRNVSMYVKPSSDRDEALDCEVYAYTALHLGPVSIVSLQAEWEAVMAQGEKLQNPDKEPEPTPVAPQQTSNWLPPRRGSWLRGGR